jgi:hypothetical protein
MPGAAWWLSSKRLSMRSLSRGTCISHQLRAVGTAGSTAKRRVPHPSRFLRRVGYHESRYQPSRIPPFAKNAKDGAPVELLRFLPSTSQGLYHDAGFHYPGNVLHHCYIVKRIRGHGDEVSKLPRLNGAEIFVQRQQLCPIDRCRL